MAYEIKNISVSDNKISSICAVKQNAFEGKAKLMVAVYDRNEFVNFYVYDVSDSPEGASFSLNTDISLASCTNSKVTAYMVDGDRDNETISNLQIYRKEKSI